MCAAAWCDDRNAGTRPPLAGSGVPSSRRRRCRRHPPVARLPTAQGAELHARCFHTCRVIQSACSLKMRLGLPLGGPPTADFRRRLAIGGAGAQETVDILSLVRRRCRCHQGAASCTLPPASCRPVVLLLPLLLAAGRLVLLLLLLSRLLACSLPLPLRCRRCCPWHLSLYVCLAHACPLRSSSPRACCRGCAARPATCSP